MGDAMNKKLAALLLVMVALLVYFFLRDDDRSDVPTREADAATSTAPAENELAASSEPTPVEREVIRAEEPPTAGGVVAPEAAGARDGHGIHGTIVATDSDGVEHPHTNGSLSLLVFKDRLGHPVTAEVVDGAFTLDADPTSTSFSEQSVELDGRLAILERKDEFGDMDLPEEGLLRLRALWPPELLLRVLGADTGTELTHVILLRSTNSDFDNWMFSQYPAGHSQQNVVIEGAPSPIVVNELGVQDSDWSFFGTWKCFVGSPGYAWTPTEVSLELGGGVQTVTLPPAGDLEVVLQGGPPDPNMFVRLYDVRSPDTTHAEHAVQGSEPIVMDGLAAGRYTVAAEIGQFGDTERIVAQEVEVLVNGRATVHLSIPSTDEPAIVAVTGTVTVPPEWQTAAFWLSMKLIGSPARGGNKGSHSFSLADMELIAASVWRFDADDVQEGLYQLEVVSEECLLSDPPATLLYTTVREVSARAESELRVVVPPPALVTLRVVDEKGVLVDVSDVNFNTKRPPESSGGRLLSPTRTSEAGVYRFAAPVGDVEIAVWDDGFAFVHEEIRLHPGQNDVALEVQRSCGVLLTIFEGETQLPWPDSWDPDLTEVDGTGGANSWSYPTAAQQQLTVDHPGLYEISIDGLLGYEIVSERQVKVEAGTVHPVVIRLRRKS